MKRKLALLVVLMLVVAVFAGCGANQTAQKVFTADQLAKYDGKNGNAAYIAVNGIVYDVSKSEDFVNGIHKQCAACVAGADVSELIKQSPHQTDKGMEDITKLPVVGTIAK